MSYQRRREHGLGFAPLAVAGGVKLASSVGGTVVGALKSIFGGGPSEEQLPGGAEYEYRNATIQTADNMARGGRRDAWTVLGALGRVKALPADINIPELPKRAKKTSTGPAGDSYGHGRAGYMASKWGDSFAPLQQQAASEYRVIESMYATPTSSVVGNAAAGGSASSPVIPALAGVLPPLNKNTLMLTVGVVGLLLIAQSAGKGR